MHKFSTGLPDCWLIQGAKLNDERGDFLKLFNATSFALSGLKTSFIESYVTTSRRGVIRGMHFQTPPVDHAKLVFCLTGSIRDGLVDLRLGSPTFGKSVSLLLNGDDSQLLYVPPGIAHGFAALEDNSRILYLVSTEYDASYDKGVRWDSVGIDWWQGLNLIPQQIISNRDQAFPALADFKTPFRYKAS